MVNVLNYINPLNKNVVIIEGWFPDTVLNMAFNDGFAFVHLDADFCMRQQKTDWIIFIQK